MASVCVFHVASSGKIENTGNIFVISVHQTVSFLLLFSDNLFLPLFGQRHLN